MDLEGFARCVMFAGCVRFAGHVRFTGCVRFAASSLLLRWLRSAAAAEHRPLSASRTQTTGDGEGHIGGE